MCGYRCLTFKVYKTLCAYVCLNFFSFLWGGQDFDLAIMDYLQKLFLKETSIDLSEETLALQRIKEAAEVAKLELTNRQNVILKYKLFLKNIFFKINENYRSQVL